MEIDIAEINKLNYKLRRAINEKEKLELQIRTNGEILKKNSNIGLHEPLVDSEGYPRDDINIIEVRRARQNIICLQNDHKALMREIEMLMHELHAKYKDKDNISNSTNQNVDEVQSSLNDERQIISLKPILKVDQVDVDSPAEQAGLRNGDEILELGTINSTNFNKNLETVKLTIQRMHNQQIPLIVSRQSEILHLILIPKTWSGGGLLGCKILLIH